MNDTPNLLINEQIINQLNFIEKAISETWNKLESVNNSKDSCSTVYFDLTCEFIINIQESLLLLEELVNKRDIRYSVICDKIAYTIMMGSVFCYNFSKGNNAYGKCIYLLQVALAIAKGTTIIGWCECNLNVLLEYNGIER